MTKEEYGWLVWGIWLLVIFCVLEGLAAFWEGCPWPTFSESVMGLQVRWDFLTVPVIAILALLISHLPDYANVRASSSYTEKLKVAHFNAGLKHMRKARELTTRTSKRI